MAYIPPKFLETNPETLYALVRDFPLATWVVPHAGELIINHIPMLLEPHQGEHGTLIGHVARANPVWKSLDTACAAVFTGPQAYISANWYPGKQAHGKEVPTYNYATVHAHGIAQAVEDPARILDILTRLTRQHEASQALPWQVADAPADFIDKLLHAIVGIEIAVQRWDGKWKVSQNRQEPEQRSVVTGLTSQGSEAAAHMAQLVAQRIAPFTQKANG